MMKRLLSSIYFAGIFLTQFAEAQRTVGLVRTDTLKASDGYTLFPALYSNNTYLIDGCGNEVNSWTSSYAPGISAVLTPDGNLLRTAFVFHKFAISGAGGRMELFNWKGDLIWEFNSYNDSFTTHHDIMLLPNGHILAIAAEKMGLNELAENGFDTSLFALDGKLMDFLLEIEMVGKDQGKIVWEWHVKDHLIQDKFPDKKNYGVIADHPELVNINYVDPAGFGNYDWLHINSVDYNPVFNQIMMSPLYFNELWIIEYTGNTSDAKGHTKGKYKKGGDLLYRWGNPQTYGRGNDSDRMVYDMHSPHWIKPGLKDSGNIMFYHNGVSRPGGSYSSIDIISPPVNASGEYSLSQGKKYEPNSLKWSYSGSGSDSFYSNYMSGAERLPNGNTFITCGDEGRFFEIDEKKEIVWEYINPVGPNGPISQGDDPPNSAVFRAVKYPSDFQGFDSVVLSGKNAVELKPLPSLCNPLLGELPVCDFKASKRQLLINEETTLSDESTGDGITGRKWTISDLQGGNLKVDIVNGNINSPTITIKFTETGYYRVKLDVSNTFGSNTISRDSFFRVMETDGIWSLQNPAENQILVYPNPAKNAVTVEGIGFYLEKADIVLRDIFGRELMHVSGATGKPVVELTGLADGIYDLSVFQQNSVCHKKIRIEAF